MMSDFGDPHRNTGRSGSKPALETNRALADRIALKLYRKKAGPDLKTLSDSLVAALDRHNRITNSNFDTEKWRFSHSVLLAALLITENPAAFAESNLNSMSLLSTKVLLGMARRIHRSQGPQPADISHRLPTFPSLDNEPVLFYKTEKLGALNKVTGAYWFIGHDDGSREQLDGATVYRSSAVGAACRICNEGALRQVFRVVYDAAETVDCFDKPRLIVQRHSDGNERPEVQATGIFIPAELLADDEFIAQLNSCARFQPGILPEMLYSQRILAANLALPERSLQDYVRASFSELFGVTPDIYQNGTVEIFFPMNRLRAAREAHSVFREVALQINAHTQTFPVLDRHGSQAMLVLPAGLVSDPAFFEYFNYYSEITSALSGLLGRNCLRRKVLRAINEDPFPVTNKTKAIISYLSEFSPNSAKDSQVKSAIDDAIFSCPLVLFEQGGKCQAEFFEILEQELNITLHEPARMDIVNLLMKSVEEEEFAILNEVIDRAAASTPGSELLNRLLNTDSIQTDSGVNRIPINTPALMPLIEKILKATIGAEHDGPGLTVEITPEGSFIVWREDQVKFESRREFAEKELADIFYWLLKI